jgi:hypothetical protein
MMLARGIVIPQNIALTGFPPPRQQNPQAKESPCEFLAEAPATTHKHAAVQLLLKLVRLFVRATLFHASSHWIGGGFEPRRSRHSFIKQTSLPCRLFTLRFESE